MPVPTLAIELRGTTAGQFDQLAVFGTCALNDARLASPQTILPFALEANMEFLIINNDGTDPILPDMFANRFSAIMGNAEFSIDYNGANNNGNDVTLTLSGMPLETPTIPTVDAGNGNNGFDPDECNELRVRLRNDHFNETIQGISAHLETDHPNVYISQADSEYDPIDPNEVDPIGKFNNTPFQVSLLPSLPCGGSIPFRLVVTTTSHGSFTVEFFMQVGLAGLCNPGSGMCALCPADFTISGRVPFFNGLLVGPKYEATGNSGLCVTPIPLVSNPDQQAAYESYLFENSGPTRGIEVELIAGCNLVSGAILDPRATGWMTNPKQLRGQRLRLWTIRIISTHPRIRSFSSSFRLPCPIIKAVETPSPRTR